jgi:hypothetical protein
VDALQEHGISAQDIAKLKASGVATIKGVQQGELFLFSLLAAKGEASWEGSHPSSLSSSSCHNHILRYTDSLCIFFTMFPSALAIAFSHCRCSA